MKSNASVIYGLVLVLGDFLALVAAFVGAYLLRVTYDARPLVEQVPAMTYLGLFLALVPFWIIVFALLGLYSQNIYEKRFNEIARLFVGSFIGLLFIITAEFVINRPIFPARLVPVYGFVLAFVFLVLFRTLARLMRQILYGYNIGITHVILVGDTAMTKELIASLSNSRKSGYKVVGVVGKERYEGVPSYSNFAEATKHIGKPKIQGIIQTELYADTARNNEILTFAQENHASFRFVPGNTELFVGNIDVELFRSSIPVINVHQTALIGWGRIVKRSFDILASLLLLIVLSPLILLIAVLVYIFSPGPILFKQKRITRFNSRFKLYKFRTTKMKYTCSTEEGFRRLGRPDLLKKYRENGDFLPNDPRFTPIGHLLRITSLDELPQLFNILKGDISLVGPRALVPEEIEKAEGKQSIVSVKSGLTGLAQVSGRRDISFEERRKLDLYYVQNWSFWLDIVILLKTLRFIIYKEKR
ncbi:exopolysaccharide biosynthesis polyprenyl glycosylphosphotransferase [Candidatus Saccharibacteria bacterium]|nr:exopolysaccharide biosynthesis polyprenyl glycosylphosphotransferase [Candidatus Saccharibacteria bacterium]